MVELKEEIIIFNKGRKRNNKVPVKMNEVYKAVLEGKSVTFQACLIGVSNSTLLKAFNSYCDSNGYELPVCPKKEIEIKIEDLDIFNSKYKAQIYHLCLSNREILLPMHTIYESISAGESMTFQTFKYHVNFIDFKKAFIDYCNKNGYAIPKRTRQKDNRTFIKISETDLYSVKKEDNKVGKNNTISLKEKIIKQIKQSSGIATYYKTSINDRKIIMSMQAEIEDNLRIMLIEEKYQMIQDIDYLISKNGFLWTEPLINAIKFNDDESSNEISSFDKLETLKKDIEEQLTKLK